MLTRRHFGAAVSVVVLATLAAPANAAMVSYFLTETNIDATLSDGVHYARVDIDDNTPNTITFNVTLIAPVLATAGIDEFAFNVAGHTQQNPLVFDANGDTTNWDLPADWVADVAPPPNQEDGFGMFDVSVNRENGNVRISPLSFALIGTGLSISSFEEGSTSNGSQPSVFFSAHIAGFDADGVTGGYFGGSTAVAIVPLPAALPLIFSGLAALGGLGFRRRSGEVVMTVADGA